MDEKLRQEIYSFFDSNGIPGRHMSSVAFSVDQDLKVNHHRPERIFEPNLYQFELFSGAADQVVIDYIFDTVNVKVSSVSELMNMRCVNGKPFFIEVLNPKNLSLKYCLAFRRIPGSCGFNGEDDIKSLGQIEEVVGDFSVCDTELKDLGGLRRVEGTFTIGHYKSYSNLYSLGQLEYVGKDLSISHSFIKDLGNLEYVGGNLNIRNLNIADLSRVKFIGGNLLLPKRLKGQVKINHIEIKGTVRHYEDGKYPWKTFLTEATTTNSAQSRQADRTS